MPSKTELFLDDELIEMTASVTRKIHPPIKHRLNPVLRPEEWWEGDCIMPLTTLYDPEEKLFYEVFRPAVQFIRQAPKDGYAINGRPIAKGGGNSRGGYGEGPPGRGGGNSRGGPAGRGNVGEYGQLAGVLPPMSRLKLEHWRAYREEAATRRSER